MKASTGDVFSNNTVIVNHTSGIGILATVSVATIATGGSFKNNIIYIDNVSAKAVVISNDGSDATFFNNDYYSNIAFSATAFAYQATVYATFAEWLAAKETSALNVDPQFLSYPIDLRVPVSNSSLYHAGVYAGSENKDYRLRPYNVKPTIGAYEVTSRDKGVSRNTRVA